MEALDRGKNIVFCPAHKTSLDVMLLIAGYMKDRQDINPVFLLGTPNMFSEEESILKKGFQVIKVYPYEWSHRHKIILALRHKISGLCDKWLSKGCPLPNFLLKACNEFYHRIEQYYRELLPILSKLKPESVLIPDDRSLVYGFLPAITKACSALNLNRVIPPISYAADYRDLGRAHHRNKQYVSKKNAVFKQYPKHLFKYDDEALPVSFYSTVATEMLARFGSLPDNPWVMGGGFSDLVLVDGEATKQRYIEYGCDSQKLVVTGHSSHDDLYEILVKKDVVRKVLRKKYRLKNKHLSILALPQLAEHNICAWDEHWKEIHFLCSSFRENAEDVLISLHPKMDRNQYQFIESEYGLAIANEPLQTILPSADSFIATFSSTVEWAVLCKIPVIVVDFYGFNYDIYDDYNGVLIVNEKNQLPSTLKRVVTDKPYSKELAYLHTEKANLLSPFDGKCVERIITACR